MLHAKSLKEILKEEFQKGDNPNNKSNKKGAFKDKIYLIDVEQDERDEKEEAELSKEWRKNN